MPFFFGTALNGRCGSWGGAGTAPHHKASPSSKEDLRRGCSAASTCACEWPNMMVKCLRNHCRYSTGDRISLYLGTWTLPLCASHFRRGLCPNDLRYLQNLEGQQTCLRIYVTVLFDYFPAPQSLASISHAPKTCFSLREFLTRPRGDFQGQGAKFVLIT